MINDNPESQPQTPPRDSGESEETSRAKPSSGPLAHWYETFLRIGLGEGILRVGTSVLSLLVILMVFFLARQFLRSAPDPFQASAVQATAATPTPSVPVDSVPQASGPVYAGIQRRATLHTIVPSRPRTEITQYTVQEGDTVFGIAEKFNLKPQTILWGNYNTMQDDPHSLSPGQELTILPVDGVYHEWLGGIPFGQWASYFGVKAEDIIDFPGNHVDASTVGDYENANIKIGTWLIVPGGKREFISWSAPLGVTRENPAQARVLGPGACDPVSGGAVGYGTFVWPAANHYLSGFEYSPESNHYGIDIAGHEGAGIFAADAGVIVYAGWNNYGYGNVIMIDHGNGFQTLYAHLSAIYVGCGQSVGQGDAIGAFGSTGRSSGAHLHFEVLTATYKPNPWDYLPAP